MLTAGADLLGLIHAEALSFALAARMPRPEAQAAVKSLCGEARATGQPLALLAHRAQPDLDLSSVFDPGTQMGQAPALARGFAAQVAGL